jgi:hypothetical protein
VEGQVDGSVVNVAIVTFKERGERLGCGGAGAMAPQYGTSVWGYFGDFVQFRTESVQFLTESVRIRTSRVLGVFLYIYLIDVNLDYY